MPECHIEIIEKFTQIAVWKITETESELVSGLTLSKEALNRLALRRSEIHRKGYLAIRQLLKRFDIHPLTHQYDDNGAPYLTDGRHLSITHTKDVAAVAISTKPVGIDMEHYQNKILKIGPRFLHREDTQDPKKVKDIHFLTQIWTAKEALYKVFRKPGIHFNTQLCIQPFKVADSKGAGTVFEDGKTHHFILHYRYFDGYCLSLATQ
ncbi:4'-phosphopantetheinyl transferase superfamily protein [Flavobacteriaceae bacterium]|nr:4'-phosphopantetheinyl transferase superfamily protein [Flavobacteriaceae bacterium]